MSYIFIIQSNQDQKDQTHQIQIDLSLYSYTRKSPREDVIVKRLQDDNLKIMGNLKLMDNFEFDINIAA